MMIEAVMYGMMPSANTANCVSAPPENRLRNDKSPPCSACCCREASAPVSMPGTGMWAPSRYSTIMASVNRILLRRSGTLKMFFRLLSTGIAPARRAARRSAVGQVVALGRRTAVTPGRRQDLDSTARGDDGGLRGGREGVGLHRDGPGDLAPAEDLDQRALADEALGQQRLGIGDVETGGLEGVEVEGLVLDPERVVEARAASASGCAAASGRPRSRRGWCRGRPGPWCRGRRSCRPCRRCHDRRACGDGWSPRRA